MGRVVVRPAHARVHRRKGRQVSTALKVAKATRELISDPEHWCQHHYALDEGGRIVGPHEEAAVKWCSEGALFKAARGLSTADRYGAMNEIGNAWRAVTHGNMPRINDQCTHDMLMAAWDQVIERLEGNSDT